MLDPNYIPDNVLTAILDYNVRPDDEDGYEKVAKLSVEQAFETFLLFHGIIGYKSTLISALDGLRLAEVKPERSHSAERSQTTSSTFPQTQR